MTRRASILWVVAVALAPVTGSAVDAPHDQSFSDGDCAKCHSLYVVSGTSGDPDYSPGCLQCHNSQTSGRLGTWLSADQAVPGTSGVHHSWSGYAQNARLGTRSPVSALTATKLVDGRLQCATCHNPHDAAPQNAPYEKHVSTPLGTGAVGGMVVATPGSSPKAYRVQIAPDGGFVLSHDFGLATPSWFVWDGAAWIPGTAAGPGKPFTVGEPVALDDDTQVQFAAGATAGQYWDFYVTWPFLRAPIQGDAFCVDCHAERVMSTYRASGADTSYPVDGVRRFSHPVGEALGSNGKGTDRPADGLLDANGVLQTAGDGNVTNDLVLPDGVMRCTTCHSVHGADSNSLTRDIQ